MGSPLSSLRTNGRPIALAFFSTFTFIFLTNVSLPGMPQFCVFFLFFPAYHPSTGRRVYSPLQTPHSRCQLQTQTTSFADCPPAFFLTFSSFLHARIRCFLVSPLLLSFSTVRYLLLRLPRRAHSFGVFVPKSSPSPPFLKPAHNLSHFFPPSPLAFFCKCFFGVLIGHTPAGSPFFTFSATL